MIRMADPNVERQPISILRMKLSPSKCFFVVISLATSSLRSEQSNEVSGSRDLLMQKIKLQAAQGVETYSLREYEQILTPHKAFLSFHVKSEYSSSFVVWMIQMESVVYGGTFSPGSPAEKEWSVMKSKDDKSNAFKIFGETMKVLRKDFSEIRKQDVSEISSSPICVSYHFGSGDRLYHGTLWLPDEQEADDDVPAVHALSLARALKRAFSD